MIDVRCEAQRNELTAYVKAHLPDGSTVRVEPGDKGMPNRLFVNIVYQMFSDKHARQVAVDFYDLPTVLRWLSAVLRDVAEGSERRAKSLLAEIEAETRQAEALAASAAAIEVEIARQAGVR